MTRLIKFSDWEIEALKQILDSKVEVLSVTFGSSKEEFEKAKCLFNKIGCNRREQYNEVEYNTSGSTI